MNNNTLYYYIYNFRPQGTPLSSAEYIVKEKNNMTGKIQLFMTETHGLGSGIYGLVPNENGEIPGAETRSNEIVTPITLVNPLILDTNEKFSKFIDLSIFLIQLCKAIINKDIKNKIVLSKNILQYELIRKELAPDTPKITSVVNNFIKTFSKMKLGDYIRQPINFLLSYQYRDNNSGYDGIYNSSPNGNRFSTGSVGFYDYEPVRRQPRGFLQGSIPIGAELYGGKLKKNKSSKKNKTTKKYKTNKKNKTSKKNKTNKKNKSN